MDDHKYPMGWLEWGEWESIEASWMIPRSKKSHLFEWKNVGYPWKPGWSGGCRFSPSNEFNFFSFDYQRICFENKMIDLFRTFSGNTRHDIRNFWVSHKEKSGCNAWNKEDVSPMQRTWKTNFTSISSFHLYSGWQHMYVFVVSIYPLVIKHGNGRYHIYRTISQLETSFLFANFLYTYVYLDTYTPVI